MPTTSSPQIPGAINVIPIRGDKATDEGIDAYCMGVPRSACPTILRGLIAAATVVCSSLANAAEPYELTDADLEVVKASVQAGLNDPESARFGVIRAVTTRPNPIKNNEGKWQTYDYLVCGMVNAKNAFGGYVGETPFMAYLGHNADPVVQLETIGDNNVGQAIYDYCAELGIKW